MIDTAVARVQAAHEAWLLAMRDLHQVSLVRLVEDGSAMATAEAAAGVLAGSTDGADAAMHLAFLDALAVVGVTVES